jgi:hypothetical protein
MSPYLAQNLEKIPDHLKAGWDVVAIVSGSGLVRTGKSTMAMQMAAYVDWCLAGGKMIWNEEGQVTGLVKPTKPLRFGLDNVVFSPEELIAITKLKGKRQKYNVFVLDEGREGLLGARVMESVNKKFEDYFQTCGVYNNFVIIVLPDFFKLAEQYCVNRSIFLVNVFHKNFERGYFSFFNTLQKERLYFFGKKRLGVSARYNAASRNFWGRFSKWLPFNETKYNNKKKAAIGKAKWTKYDVAQMKQRDLLCYLLYKNTNLTLKEISEKMSQIGSKEYTPALVARSLFNAKRIQKQEKYIVDDGELPEDFEQDVDFKNMDQGALEKIKDPKVMAGFSKEYDNTDLSTNKIVEGVLPEGARVVDTSKIYLDKNGAVSNLGQSADADDDEGANFAVGPLDPQRRVMDPPEKIKKVTDFDAHPKRITKALEEMQNPDDPYGDDEITLEKYKLPERHTRNPDRDSGEDEIDPDKTEVPFELDEELLEDPKFKQDFGSHGKDFKKEIGIVKKSEQDLKDSKKKVEEDYSEHIYKG